MEKLKVSKDFGKNYKNDLIYTCVINNFKPVRVITQKNYNDAHELFLNGDENGARSLTRKIMTHTQSNVEGLKNLFGKQDFVYRHEYNSYAWAVIHEGCKAIIFSGNGKGTSVEVLVDENDKSKGDVEKFYIEFCKIMENLSNNK